MKSILSAVQKQNIPIKPTIVISNKPSSKGLKIASKLGVQTEIESRVTHETLSNTQTYFLNMFHILGSRK